MNKVILRKGTTADLTAMTIPLASGEPAFIDQSKFYIGNGTANPVEISGGSSSSSLSTVHLNGAGAVLVKEEHFGNMIHIESGTSIALAKADFTKDGSLYIQNHSGTQLPVNFTGVFEGVYDAGKQSDLIATQTTTLEYLEIMLVVVTENSGSKFINFTKLSGKIETGSWVPTITFTAVDPDVSGATVSLYKAIYTRIDDKVNFNLSFGINSFTAGRYLIGSYTLPKTRIGTESIISVVNSSFTSQYVPTYALLFFSIPTIFIGTPDIRLPASSLVTINVIGSYVTNEA